MYRMFVVTDRMPPLLTNISILFLALVGFCHGFSNERITKLGTVLSVSKSVIPTPLLAARASEDESEMEDEEQSETITAEPINAIDDEDLLFDFKPKLTKVNQKKKRYLILRDVKNAIERNHPKALVQAQRAVKQILEEKEDNEMWRRPALQAYNLLVHAIAKSEIENAVEMTEEVLEDMRVHEVPPNHFTYAAMMDAYARLSSPEKAEKFFFHLMSTDVIDGPEASSVTVDTMLNAWAQQGTVEGAERAELILSRLEALKNDEISPTEYSYATVMNAWAEVGTVAAAKRTESLLERMTIDGRVKVDTTIFNTVLKAWAATESADACRRTGKLLNRMKELSKSGKYDSSPDLVSYNTVLSAWSRSGDANAPFQVEKLVQEMRDAAKSSDGAPVPNTVTYNIILHAWSMSKSEEAAPRAQKILEYMITSGDDEIMPDVISFTSVLTAWGRSNDPRKGSKAKALLDRLLGIYANTRTPSLRPTSFPFNAVLNACAFTAIHAPTEDRREALQIAVNTFTTMKKAHVELDSITYGTIIKCLNNLMPRGEARNKMALQLFDKCCDEGLVGSFVWAQLLQTVPYHVLDRKLGLRKPVKNIKFHTLPKRWRARGIGRKRTSPEENDTNESKQQQQQQQQQQHSEAEVQRAAVVFEASAQSTRDL